MPRDGFDTVLNSQISIWKKGGSGVVDGYGIESQVFTLLVSGVACRIDELQGKELDTAVAFGEQTFTFFMRPIAVDFPAVPLNIHHWIQINVKHGESLADPDPNGTMYDIKNIRNLYNHHLQVDSVVLEP
jgi:hypothetical protein